MALEEALARIAISSIVGLAMGPPPDISMLGSPDAPKDTLDALEDSDTAAIAQHLLADMDARQTFVNQLRRAVQFADSSRSVVCTVDPVYLQALNVRWPVILIGSRNFSETGPHLEQTRCIAITPKGFRNAGRLTLQALQRAHRQMGGWEG